MNSPGSSPLSNQRLLVIGGGVAGASVAYFAARQGYAVTLVDAGQGRASDVPSALLNPVRGQAGRVDPRALAGLHLSWSLIGALGAAGHAVPHEACGVLRPFASDGARAKASRNLPADLPHRWLGPQDSPVPLAPGWPHQLWLPEGGWVSGGGLVRALVAASGATCRPARAVSWDARSAALEGGERLEADLVVWCGGSLGASWGGGSGMIVPENDPAQTHRGGSLLLLDRPATPLPVSAGVYLAPAGIGPGAGGVLGATFEAPTSAYQSGGPPPKSLHWLLERAAALSPDLAPVVTGLWTGSRLAGELSGRQPGGWWALAGLGSKGFLLGPLLALQLVGQIADAQKQNGQTTTA